MTLINVASSIIYTKGASLREKIQTYGLALVFLVLLYNSPSGLVFYWVLNQIFSLCKNIVNDMKHPKRIVYGVLVLMLMVVCAYLLLFKEHKFSATKCMFYFIALIFISAPFVWKLLKSKKVFEKIRFSDFVGSDKQSFVLLLGACIALCLLCGVLLPSSAIATSPVEFSFLGNTDSPLSYVWSSLAFFAGVFVFWPLVIYKLFDGNVKVKRFMPLIFFVLAMCALANAFIFKYNYGEVSILFKLADTNILKNRSFFFSLFPFLFFLCSCFIYFIFSKKNKKKNLCFFVISICIGMSFLCFVKLNKISSQYLAFSKEHKNKEVFSSNVITPEFHLSKTKPNVIVFFFDRAISYFFPYILEQFPDMKNSYDGFVYYPNCLTLAGMTNIATPSMMGGYEYSIEELNKRSGELLKNKHNEATLVLPKIFSNAGFETKLFGVPYLNYDELPVPSDFNFTNLVAPSSKYVNKYMNEMNLNFSNVDIQCEQAIKKFVLMEILYPPIRGLFYNVTDYDKLSQKKKLNNFFVEYYAKLFYLAEDFDTSSEKPTFHFIGNDMTHMYTTLLDGYIPGDIDENHKKASTGSYKWHIDESSGYINDFQAYHVNAAAHIQVAKFLDALKRNGIYDNTRIIIVADHGYEVPLDAFINFEEPEAGRFNPLLLFKDFNSHGEPVTDGNLRTNADTPALAIKNLDISGINPYTGNKICFSDDFDSFNVYQFISVGTVDRSNIQIYKNRSQIPMSWLYGYNIHDNIFDESNWKKLDTSEAKK